MAKITERVRTELLSTELEERTQQRCALCKELHAAGKELTADITADIDGLDEVIKTLAAERDALIEKRTEMLREAKLKDFVVYGRNCAVDILHPRLIAFDAETNERKTEILLK